MPDEVEVDPLKICTQRFAHRSIEGIDVDGVRVCPACLEVTEEATG